MKFFLVFQSCYRPTVRNSASVIPQEKVTTPTTTSTKLNQGRIKSGSASHWRPKLSSISEENICASAPQRKGQRCVGSQKKTSCKGRSTAKSDSFRYDNEYYRGNNAMGIMIPAFSPTPFMF